jgi:hypothetical protein
MPTRLVLMGVGREQLNIKLTFVASCLRGALPPVLLRAVCLVRAMSSLVLVLQQRVVRKKQSDACKDTTVSTQLRIEHMKQQ